MRKLRNLKRRTKVLLIASGIVVAMATTAGAYYVLSASGTGSVAATGSLAGPGTTPVTLTGALNASSFAGPGSTASITLGVNNPSPTPKAFLTTIHLASVTPDAGHSACDTSKFTMPDVVENQTLPQGTTAPALTVPSATVTWANNVSVDQGNCAGASLTFNLTTP